MSARPRPVRIESLTDVDTGLKGNQFPRFGGSHSGEKSLLGTPTRLRDAQVNPRLSISGSC